MKFIRNTIICCLCLFLFPLNHLQAFDADDLYSENFMLLDSQDEGIMFGKNIEKTIYPASMTKIMTAIIIIENTQDYEKKLVINQKDADIGIAENTSVIGLEEGEVLSVKDALYCILLASGSDAAYASASYLAGSEEAFVEIMNKKVQSLNLKNTHFENSIGLHNKNHYSSVYDMAVLFNYCMKNEKFREIIGTKNFKLTTNKRKNYEINSYYNLLFDKAHIKHDYIVGAKTGYTFEAGDCMVSMAHIDGRDYIFASAEGKGNYDARTNIIDAGIVYQNLLLRESIVKVVKKGKKINDTFINMDIYASINTKMKEKNNNVSIEKEMLVIRNNSEIIKRIPLDKITFKKNSSVNTEVFISIGLPFVVCLTLLWCFRKGDKKNDRFYKKNTD